VNKEMEELIGAKHNNISDSQPKTEKYLSMLATTPKSENISLKVLHTPIYS